MTCGVDFGEVVWACACCGLLGLGLGWLLGLKDSGPRKP